MQPNECSLSENGSKFCTPSCYQVKTDLLKSGFIKLKKVQNINMLNLGSDWSYQFGKGPFHAIAGRCPVYYQYRQSGNFKHCQDIGSVLLSPPYMRKCFYCVLLTPVL